MMTLNLNQQLSKIFFQLLAFVFSCECSINYLNEFLIHIIPNSDDFSWNNPQTFEKYLLNYGNWNLQVFFLDIYQLLS